MQLLALLPHSKRFKPTGWLGTSVWSLHVLPVLAWVLSGYLGFLSQCKEMVVRVIIGSTLAVGVNVTVNCCLFLCVNSAIACRPVHGVACLLRSDSWERLQLCRWLEA